MKILLVEDEKSLATAIKKGLEKKGCDVTIAPDGREALNLFFESLFDVVVLDLNLPYVDGMEVLNEIRKTDDEIKILILSARSATEEKVKGLLGGANDFLAKPFDFSELFARITALSRRNFSLVRNEVVIGCVRIDFVAKRIFVFEEEVSFSKKEYEILEYLALNKNRTVPSSEIIERLWEEGDLNSLKVHINKIRKKLGESGLDTIRTVRGIGYGIGIGG